MNWLTRQEQVILCIVLGLFLLGLSMKAYRLANAQPAMPVKTEEKAEESGKR